MVDFSLASSYLRAIVIFTVNEAVGADGRLSRAVGQAVHTFTLPRSRARRAWLWNFPVFDDLGSDANAFKRGHSAINHPAKRH
jgi:hypothetical protein